MNEFIYGSEQTPIGWLTVVQSSSGVLAIGFGRRKVPELRAEVEQRLGRSVGLARGEVSGTVSELTRLLLGNPAHVPIDWSGLTPFRRGVMQALQRVPRGQTITYAQLAQQVGNPKAARAVGGVMRTNPLVIVVPCHRVVAAGGLGGFTGGVSLKKKLLTLEGTPLPSS